MSHQGFDITFKEFKEQFYSRIGDGTCLNVLDINLLKVVLDGLKVQYTKRGKISHYFDKHNFIVYCYFLIKLTLAVKKRILLKKKVQSCASNSTIIGFSDRTIESDSKEVPIYYQKIFNEFGRESFCCITNKEQIFSDLNTSDFILGVNIFSKRNRLLYLALKEKLCSLDFINLWTSEELENIKISVFLFFVDYVKWDFVLTQNKFKNALLICHYHNEAFILACKRNNIQVRELQHGLIAEEDIFYVFPDQVKSVIHKALFPSAIYVYGSFWKDVLLKGCEYNGEAINELGYYHFEATYKSDININSEKKILLITTQYSAEKYFIQFIKNISPKLNTDWIIQLKPHPSENTAIYSYLEKDFLNVKVVQGSLEQIINRSEFLVTIFSTTIFDALRLRKLSFSLQIDLYSDYIANLVNIGASHLLDVNDNPTELYLSLDIKKNTTQFYSEFSKTNLKTFLRI